MNSSSVNAAEQPTNSSWKNPPSEGHVRWTVFSQCAFCSYDSIRYMCTYIVRRVYSWCEQRRGADLFTKHLHVNRTCKEVVFHQNDLNRFCRILLPRLHLPIIQNGNFMQMQALLCRLRFTICCTCTATIYNYPRLIAQVRYFKERKKLWKNYPH